MRKQSAKKIKAKSNLDILKELAFNGLANKIPDFKEKELNRLISELGAVEKLNSEGYFLTLHRICEVCNRKGYLRSPGRGSACGSLLNYCLGITNINPLEYGLYFERFLNSNETKVPDIDIDIPQGIRDELIQALKLEFAKYNVCQVLFNPKKNSDNSFPNLKYKNKQYSIHSSIIIIPKGVKNIGVKKIKFNSENYFILENFDQEFEILKPYKFDLVELPYLNKLAVIVNQLDALIHPYHIKLNDPEVFKVFSSGRWKNVFLYEAKQFKKTYKEFKPSSIIDLAIMDALYRPGPMNNIPEVIKNKNSGSIVNFPKNPELDVILNQTYGIILFQETYMQIMKEFAGIDLMLADSFRIGFWKKNNASIIRKFKAEFKKGCLKNGQLSLKETEKLTTMILNAAPYAMQKSHFIGHAALTYWAAYYRTYFRDQFYNVMN